ncbi:UNVERIFIED_CONTAM: hypothetical protein BEN50_25685 [Euhalothece sp. KZN 001]
MPKCKPCLGYPSRTAAVLDLARQGHSDAEIAELTGIPHAHVAPLRHSGRRSFAPVRVPRDTLYGLRVLAAGRGMSVNELACRLLDAIVAGDLAAAVLDDEGE